MKKRSLIKQKSKAGGSPLDKDKKLSEIYNMLVAKSPILNAQKKDGTKPPSMGFPPMISNITDLKRELNAIVRKDDDKFGNPLGYLESWRRSKREAFKVVKAQKEKGMLIAFT